QPVERALRDEVVVAEQREQAAGVVQGHALRTPPGRAARLAAVRRTALSERRRTVTQEVTRWARPDARMAPESPCGPRPAGPNLRGRPPAIRTRRGSHDPL